MADKLALGKQFMADLLARVPDDQRATVAATLEADEGVLGFLGEGVLRQQDYSRNMNELSTKHQELTTWYETNKAALEAAARGRTGDPAPQPVGLDRKAMEEFVNERERGVANYITATTDLAFRHFQEFGERLDLSKLLGDPDVAKLGLLGVYDRTYAPKYAEKATAAETARVEKLVGERMTEERKKLIGQPYPVSPHDPSPLDVLEAPAGGDKFSAQAAADEYTALVARRQSAPA